MIWTKAIFSLTLNPWDNIAAVGLAGGFTRTHHIWERLVGDLAAKHLE